VSPISRSGERVDITLDARPGSVTVARHAVAQMLDAEGLAPSELSEDVLLLVSELVANAVLHAGTVVRVWAAADAGRVLVSVGDDDPHSAPLQLDRGLFATSGRGIRLLEMLASAWGVEVFDSSKVVWFEAAHRPDALAARIGSS